jgi:hypothetical protein
MAGLNDDIEPDDDIESELPGSPKNPVKAGEFIVPHPEELATGHNQPVAPEINIVVDKPLVDDNGEPVKPTARDLFGKDIVPNELPDLNAEIILVDEVANKITDASGVYDSITNAHAISQESILEIDSILPGYLNENEIIEYYTKTPTLTRYETATNKIGYEIAKQKQEHDKMALDIFMKLKSSVETAIAYIDEHLIYDREGINSVLRKASDAVDDLFIEGTLTDIKVSLKKAWSEDSAADLTQSSFRELSEPAQAIVAALEKSTALHSFFLADNFLDQEKVFACLRDPSIHAEKTITITPRDVTNILAGQNLAEIIKHLKGILVSAMTYIDEASFAVTNKEASDVGKVQDPLQTLKREAQALTDVTVLINDLIGCYRNAHMLMLNFVQVCNSGV